MMSWDWMEDKGFFFSEDYYNDEDVCPGCGSTNIKASQSLENTDADGNRGAWVRHIYCRDCREEYSMYV